MSPIPQTQRREAATGTCALFFLWGIENGFVDENPVDAVSKPRKEEKMKPS